MQNLTPLEENVLAEMVKEVIRPESPFITVPDVKYQLEYHRLNGELASTQLAKANYDYIVEHYNLTLKEAKHFRDYLSSIK